MPYYTSVQQQMIDCLNQAQQRPTRMDPYLGSTYGSEQSLYDSPVNDKALLDKSVYAPSPNLLNMYEQEKADMQSSLGNMSCSRTNSMTSEDFEQAENSQDICPPTTKSSNSFRGDDNGNQNYSNTWALDKKDIDFLNCDIFPMEEEMDNPTLAELNASESLLDDLACIVNSEYNENGVAKTWTNSTQQQQQQTVSETKQFHQLSSWPQTTQVTGQFVLSKVGTNNMNSRKPSATITSETDARKGTVPRLHQLLQKNKTSPSETEAKTVSSPVQSVPNVKLQSSPGKRKSISNVEVDEKWEEIKHYIYDEEEEKRAVTRPKQTRLSSGSYKSTVTSNDDSDAESDKESQIDSDSDFDDNNSQDSWSYKQEADSQSRKSRQYFWQYNLQSKGPKGARVNFEQLENDDPHVLKDFEDPVFDPVASKFVAGTTIRHGGKARRGDGTDVSPNPKKLYQIGQQINKLNKQIDSFIPLSEMPVASRNKSKKEKNKLASRACRLKKKAQHEAYKIKLHGLDMEHKQLLQITENMKKKFADVLEKSLPEKKEGTDGCSQMTQYLDNLLKRAYTYKVAGDTTDFVNRVLCKVEEGDTTGGLDQS